nr:MAG TPA: hypothetical protein [Caudoviricetes sp.]
MEAGLGYRLRGWSRLPDRPPIVETGVLWNGVMF